MSNPFANTIKFLAAINLLASPAGVTVKNLMEKLSISRRTAFRLLDALEALGFPLVDEWPSSKNGKIYRLMDSYILKLPNMNIPNPGFTPQELELLFSVLDLFDTVQQPDNMSLINSIRSKLSAAPFAGIGQKVP